MKKKSSIQFSRIPNSLWLASKKIPRTMKLFVLFLICSLGLTYAADSYAQTAVVNVEAQNKTVGEILKDIENQSEFGFFFSNKHIDLNRRVSVSSRNSDIFKVLEKVFEGTNVKYSVLDKKIVLTTLADNAQAAQQSALKVKGKVVDETGESVIGASVLVKGTGNGTVTDIDGNFELAVSAKEVTLEVSFIGYSKTTVKAKAGVLAKIVLKEDTELLDEVVVVAYGTQKKSNLTGSVDVVGSKEMANRPVTSASAMLQGKASSITFSTPSGGNAPGSNPTLQIRGQAALDGATPPLVVIDGIPSDMGAFNALNPNDIESISVLKDAAASAVYGARAPYGVLLVTTKMGENNEKATVTYSGNYGIVNPVRMPKTLDSYTFAVMRNEAYINARSQAPFTDEDLDIIKDNIDHPGKYAPEDLISTSGNQWGKSLYNVDWMDVLLQPAFRHQHDLSLRGGSAKSSYNVSVGYVYQPGILNFVEDIDNYSRFNVNAAISSDVTDWLKVTYRNRYSFETTKEPTGGYGQGRARMFDFAYGAWPTFPVKYPDGSYDGNLAVNMYGGHKKNMGHRLDNILAFDLKLAKGWTAHVDGTWRMNFADNMTLRKPVYSTNPMGDEFLQNGTESSIAKSTASNQYWTIQGYTAYELQLKRHSFRIQLGAQAEENNYRTISGTARDLFVYDMESAHIAQGNRTFDDAMNDWATAGFFGRFNYNWAERYFLEVNGRYDGSGRYSRGNRWGFFPSVFGAWNMSNEPFWEKLKDVVNYARVKASYGTLGNQGNSAGYLHIPTMTTGSQGPWIIDGKRPTYVATPGLLNKVRTWEKITTLDLGVEARFLNNQLTMELGYFNRRSWDIIGPPTPLPAVLGASAPNVNNAELVTKGFEAQVSWRDKITKNLDYSVGFNLADATTEVTKYNNTSRGLNQWWKGKKFGDIWGYEVEGLLTEADFGADGKLLIDQSKINANWYPGDIKYKDLDGDGKITPGTSTADDPGDLRIIGNSTPRFRYGINLALGYEFEKAGRLDLTMFFQGVAKRDIFMSGSFYYFGAGMNASSSRGTSIYDNKEQKDFYRDENSSERLLELLGENKNAFFPRPYETSEGTKNFQTNTRFLLNGAYLRMKNLQLSYTLPKMWAQKVGMSSCRVYFSGENLFVLSSLPSHIDPESVNNGRMYPQQAVYSFGVNVSF